MLMPAAANGVSLIDIVQIDFRDQVQLIEESQRSFQQRCTRKNAQIEPVHQAFSSPIKAINHAAAITKAHEGQQ